MAGTGRHTDHQSRLDWWRRQIQRQRMANLTVTDFCRQPGVSVATVTVSLGPTDNRAWAAKMQSPSNASGPAVGNPALRAAQPTVRQPAA